MATIYTPVIGLEIHAELNTKTKMFCGCLNDPDEKTPNTNICPVCTGQPGALPVANKAAIEALIKVGTALNGDIPAVSKFDRKNYFYPDLPKGYQISQYDLPFVSGGFLKGVKITRVHLEEDTGRLMHSGEATLVDYNRSSVPLMELVTEPDIRSAEQVGEFATELQLLLRYLGVSDADMEKGQMRVEVNLSLGTMVDGKLKYGTKVEVKNINSFKAAVAAAKYEIERQTKALETGSETIVQETRGWDDVKKITVSQRKKESSHDYRYFPEPDIPPIDLSLFDFKRLKSEIPELPQPKRVRFVKEYNLPADQIEVLVLDRPMAEYFEGVASELKEHAPADLNKAYSIAANYLTSDLRGLMVSKGVDDLSTIKITAENFADLVLLVADEKISSRAAKDVLAKMFEVGGDPNEIVASEGHGQVSDKAVFIPLAQELIAANPNPVADYKKGKEQALMFFVGQMMRKAREQKLSPNPNMLKELFKELLS